MSEPKNTFKVKIKQVYRIDKDTMENNDVLINFIAKLRKDFADADLEVEISNSYSTYY